VIERVLCTGWYEFKFNGKLIKRHEIKQRRRQLNKLSLYNMNLGKLGNIIYVSELFLDQILVTVTKKRCSKHLMVSMEENGKVGYLLQWRGG
jgi:hypothetical protein